jgi:hypothetical protein
MVSLTVWFYHVQVFWVAPPEGFVGPSVEDLRRCEQAGLRQVFRTVFTTQCSVEDALQATVAGLAW